MYRIYCLDTKEMEPDLFGSFDEAVQMIRYFIQDDSESFEYINNSYGVVDKGNKLLCILKDDTYIDLKAFNFAVNIK